MNKAEDDKIFTERSDNTGNIRLGFKFAVMGACSVLITAAAFVIIAIWQSGQYNKLAQSEVDKLISEGLNHITRGIYNLVQSEDEATQIQVNGNLYVAYHILSDKGEISLSDDKLEWDAVNQFSGKSQKVILPKFLLGNNWIGKNHDISKLTPVVDEVNQIVGEYATIFQRINQKGDMLRIATGLKTPENKRAIGTFIPAVNPDGSKNPIITSMLSNDIYRGRSFIEDSWYLAAYKPLNDKNGNIVGMISYAISQKTVEERIRQKILHTLVGKTGYVYVIGSSGKELGHYIISHKGERDGENIWDNKDSDGRYVIREIIKTTTSLASKEMATLRYRWQNPGEKEPRWKIVRLIYYAPWNWVIGTSVYEDELQVYSSLLSNGRHSMVNIMSLAGILIICFVGIIFIFIALKITRPVKEMTSVAEKIIGGDLSQVINVSSRDEIGILAHTFNTMTSKLKVTMDNLVKSEEKYRGIFNNAIEGLFQNSLDGKILNINPAMAHILGYDSPEDLITTVKSVRDQLYVNPGDREQIVKRLREHGAIFESEVEFYKKNRQKIWVSISARLIRTDNSDVPVIEGFIVDISQRKLAEDALSESRNYLNEIINTVADPLFVKDKDFKLVLVNNAMCELTGIPGERLLGLTNYDYCSKEEADTFNAEDRLVLDKGIEYTGEASFTDSSGSRHIILTKKTRYSDKTGNKFVVGIIRDITEYKTAEEEKNRLEARLAQSQKMEAIGTLAGGIAHDFNNILSAIIGYTQLALDDIEKDLKVRGSLKEVLKSSERARELIKQILSFSRMKKDESSTLNIKNAIKESIRMLRPIIPSNIEINEELNCSPFVMSNQTHLNQIMLNLCSNAAHSMDVSGGTLGISLTRLNISKNNRPFEENLQDGKYVKISISDTGKGIPPEIRERIFEPYFTTKETGKGTGLGLSVIHGIIKSQKGAITCSSNDTGGTTFDVYLPEIDADLIDEQVPDSEEMITGSGNILVVDDEPVLINLMTQMLERLGYKVASSTSSPEGLQLFKDNPDQYDLVITDMTMPKMTGDTLAKEILAVRKNTPVILCTGYNEHISKEGAKAAGIVEFLMKPVDMKKLSVLVHKVLQQYSE